MAAIHTIRATSHRRGCPFLIKIPLVVSIPRRILPVDHDIRIVLPNEMHAALAAAKRTGRPARVAPRSDLDDQVQRPKIRVAVRQVVTLPVAPDPELVDGDLSACAVGKSVDGNAPAE